MGIKGEVAYLESTIYYHQQEIKKLQAELDKAKNKVSKIRLADVSSKRGLWYNGAGDEFENVETFALLGAGSVIMGLVNENKYNDISLEDAKEFGETLVRLYNDYVDELTKE